MSKPLPCNQGRQGPNPTPYEGKFKVKHKVIDFIWQRYKHQQKMQGRLAAGCINITISIF